MDRLESVREALRLHNTATPPDFEALDAELASLKRDAVASGDEPFAKEIWCLEGVGYIQGLFYTTFRQLKDQEYYDAWCNLDRIEVALNGLRRHYAANWSKYRLDFIERITLSLQTLYPYTWFGSPEWIHTSSCSICNQTITPRKPCGHVLGEIYGGEQCVRVIHNLEMRALAIVKHPVQKYTVLFIPQNDKSAYPTLKYLVDRWPDPFASWEVEWTTRERSKADFGRIGRNDKCPYLSGKKYKQCCMNRKGIPIQHAKFWLSYRVSDELNVEGFGRG